MHAPQRKDDREDMLYLKKISWSCEWYIRILVILRRLVQKRRGERMKSREEVMRVAV